MTKSDLKKSKQQVKEITNNTKVVIKNAIIDLVKHIVGKGNYGYFFIKLAKPVISSKSVASGTSTMLECQIITAIDVNIFDRTGSEECHLFACVNNDYSTCTILPRDIEFLYAIYSDLMWQIEHGVAKASIYP